MRGKAQPGLFRIAGVPVRIHFSWIFAAVYLTWLFTRQFWQLAQVAEIEDRNVLVSPFVWGILMTLALFAGVLLHELGHVLVARRGGARVHSITLMMLGGISEIGEVEQPRVERRMAAAGPLVSFGLALVAYGLYRLTRNGPADVQFGLFYLAQINLIIGAFNLLPAFPMDGGRVLRSSLVERFGKLRATQIAATVGKIFAVAMVLFGLIAGSLWLMLIAMFLFIGADAETRGVQMHAALRGLRVADVYTREVATVDASATTANAASALLAARKEVCVVVSAGKPIGMATAQALAEIPVRERAQVPIGEVMQPVILVRPDDELPSVLRMLESDRRDAVIVAEGDQLLGSLTREDIVRALQLRELALGRG